MSKDLQGREYAKLADLKVGDRIEVDEGFECCEPHSVYTLRLDEHGELYFVCRMGYHGIQPQLDGLGYLVGIYHANQT